MADISVLGIAPEPAGRRLSAAAIYVSKNKELPAAGALEGRLDW